MALKTLVKVGEITNLSDARYCAGMGVDMLGFSLDPNSSSYVSPEQFKEITDWVAGVKFVGELPEEVPGEIRNIIGDYSLDYLQVSDDNLSIISVVNLPLIVGVNSSNLPKIEASIQETGEVADYFLVEGYTDVLSLEKLSSKYPMIIGDGVEVETIEDILDSSLKGIALKGSIEEKPGFKDYDQLADILEALEIEG